MARKAKETTHLRLRVEQSLLQRLEKAAERNDRTLTGECVHRLEDSFELAKQVSEKLFIVEVLLAGGPNQQLLRMIATVLKIAGPDWMQHTLSKLPVADAINKLMAVFIGELPSVEESFPDRQDKTSADHLAWLAILTERYHFAVKHEAKGGTT